jgi:hypothetical protein
MLPSPFYAYTVTCPWQAVKEIGYEMRTIPDLDENAVVVPNTHPHNRHPQTQRHKASFNHTYQIVNELWDT